MGGHFSNRTEIGGKKIGGGKISVARSGLSAMTPPWVRYLEREREGRGGDARWGSQWGSRGRDV